MNEPTAVRSRPSRIVWIALIGAILPLTAALAREPLVVARGPGGGVAVLATDAAGGAYLGVRTEEETTDPEGGARVTEVIDGSPADRAGLRRGDVIVGIDGDPVRGPAGLRRRLEEREPGARVEVTVRRGDAERSLVAELQERETVVWKLRDVEPMLGELHLDLEDIGDLGAEISEGLVRVCENDDCRSFGWPLGNRPLLGVELSAVTPELRVHLGGDEDTGVLVGRVLPGTPAEDADVRVGDLIVEVNDRPIRSASDIRRALEGRSGEIVTVEVIRDRARRRIDVALPETEQPPTGPRARRRAPDRLPRSVPAT